MMPESPTHNSATRTEAELVARLGTNECAPVFLLGAFRSGTTLLYRMLTETGCFNITTAYHVLNYRELLTTHAAGRTQSAREELTQRFRELNLSTRQLDAIELSTDMPEEYGFVLVRELRQRQVNRKSLSKFLELCRKTLAVSESPDKPLLLKNPWDFDNFQQIRTLIPQARFVFVHRDPIDTVNSQLKALRQIWHDGNAYAQMLGGERGKWLDNSVVHAILSWATDPHSRVRLAERLLVRYATRWTTGYLDRIAALPKDCYHELRYEDLCRQPNESIRDIMTFLGEQPENVVDYRDEIAVRPTNLLPGLLARKAALQQKFERYRRAWGYTGTATAARS
jgi:hypothetical protein